MLRFVHLAHRSLVLAPAHDVSLGRRRGVRLLVSLFLLLGLGLDETLLGVSHESSVVFLFLLLLSSFLRSLAATFG